MWRKGLVGSSAGLLLASWGICAVSIATAPGAQGEGAVLAASAVIAGTFTCLDLVFIPLAWNGEESAMPAVVVTLLAIPAILWLALVPRLGG